MINFFTDVFNKQNNTPPLNSQPLNLGAKPKINNTFSFGLNNTQSSIGPTKINADAITDTKKSEEAKSEYFDKTHKLSNNLTDNDRQTAKDYIDNVIQSGKGIDTDSMEFRCLPPNAQKFIHAQLSYLTGTDTTKIPYGQKQEVNLKPEFC